MRRAITFLLLAATAGPLAAQTWSGQGSGRDGRDDGRDAGAPTTWRAEVGTRDTPRPDRDDPRAAFDRDDPRSGRNASRDDPRLRDEEREARFGYSDRRYRDGSDDPRFGDGDRRGDRRYPVEEDRARPGWRGDPRDRSGYHRTGPRGWDTRWREDRRYDWQGYRAGNRAVYRAPRYYDPRGGAYRRWTRGYRVEPSFYGRDYRIADPWRYRLPPADAPYGWVRYYDDVALIDLRSGLIEDILYGFFWR